MGRATYVLATTMIAKMMAIRTAATGQFMDHSSLGHRVRESNLLAGVLLQPESHAARFSQSGPNVLSHAIYLVESGVARCCSGIARGVAFGQILDLIVPDAFGVMGIFAADGTTGIRSF